MRRLRIRLTRMKVRRHRLFLICSAGLCIFSLLYSVVALLRRLSTYRTHLAVLNSFFWKDELVVSPSRDSPRPKDKDYINPEDVIRERMYEKKEPDKWKPRPNKQLHERAFVLQDDPAPHFFYTKDGSLCLRRGAEKSSDQPNATFTNHTNREKCVCRQGWHGPHCGVPTVVQHSDLPTKSHLKPRRVPRRIINAININHEFDLLHARFHELAHVVDLFLVCESNYTAYGKPKPLKFLHLLLNGTFNYMKHKILYVLLDHFPTGAYSNGWIVDDYLRTFLTKNGLLRVWGLRPDDVFVLNDADEIPLWDGLLFIKLYDGWTEPFAIHMRKSLYGFFWKQPGTLDILSGCTVAMLLAVYKADGILLRRREYYTMPGFREYQNSTGQVLMQWSIGSPVHFAGWHCSWCFRPEGIHFKLVSAQNGDFPRWGDYEEKRKLSYIENLIRTGGWFDGTVANYPPASRRDHMFAPKYVLDNFKRYHYLLENPYVNDEERSR
ncbi:beta-1,4-mannosyl-glycoprotein 4-beta-N-acetylglucosaminyltransferase-like [Trichomycterus rosablanca]|uniref:beta-1,4-mannosyl-glycoprotein 4-beta-N-acetylglucosaminyltransferase-like n=1 Tax=Trichomycterus rosablanca TaxID=2290929 RepID=UPI002F35FBB5